MPKLTVDDVTKEQLIRALKAERAKVTVAEERVKMYAEELKATKIAHRKAWQAFYDIIIDAGLWHGIQGWYWHKDRYPFYADSITQDGFLTGWGISKAMGTIVYTTEEVPFEKLTRIDANLDDLED